MKETWQNLVESTIANCLRNKLENYSPESKEMPFHYRLIGNDRMALFSFIHSLNTSFGTSIFEPVAKTLALSQGRFLQAKTQHVIGDTIFEKNQAVITRILDSLRSAESKPDKLNEIQLIRDSLSGKTHKIKATKVDLFLEDKNGNHWLFDIKSPKPNKGEFQGFKRSLLEWVAIAQLNGCAHDIHSCIAFPYNPYAPRPYDRWTMTGLFDLSQEVKVAEEFWDFLGGDGTYEKLLQCFARVGDAMRDEIDKYFKRFKT